MSNTSRNPFRGRKSSSTGKSIIQKEVPHSIEEISGQKPHSAIDGSTKIKGFVDTINIIINKTKPKKNKK